MVTFNPVEDILEARADAESLMLDACTVHRSGAVVTDPATGKVTRPKTLVYDGKCRLQQTIAQGRQSVAGEHEFTEQDARWDTPVGSGPFAVGDLVTMTVARLDDQLVGRTYRVAGRFNKSGATAQRIRVEEVIS
jgi:hypothetical protein